MGTQIAVFSRATRDRPPWRTLIRPVLGFPAFGGWLATAGQPGGPSVPLSYAFLGVLAAVLATACPWPRTLPRSLRGWAVALAAVLALLTFGLLDSYAVVIRGEHGFSSTTFRRWTGEPRWRFIYVEGLAPARAWTSEGPLSPGGVRHGRWEDYEFGHNARRYSWYWYGEPVTEGEFAMRSR